MAVNRNQIQAALRKPYDRILFSKEVLSPVFNSGFSLNAIPIEADIQPNKSEAAVINHVRIYANIQLDDATDVTCYEIQLQPGKLVEQNKVAIQQYVRKLLTVGQAALVNFISPGTLDAWRLTLIAKDSEITEKGIKEKTTHAKRFTYLLGTAESCKTAAERFEMLSTERIIDFQALVRAFSVEKLSDSFFDEYKRHYLKFCNYLQESQYRRSVFNISFPSNATQEEKDKACKPIRDFTKKLLGRIVFLYFVQKKGWLGASDANYRDGMPEFIMQLFTTSGGDESFYNNWLSALFFDTLNKERSNADFRMPDGRTVKIPFLNGGLFDKEEYDERLLTFPATLFHNADNPEEPNYRGFFNFLDAFNFTVHEDSPDDQIVAVDPEMLGHIFENLLEDNKDKGTYYTPKEIVHYMCQESLIEYLTIHLSKEYTVYRQLSNDQIELYGNEEHIDQLKMVEQLGEKALSRDDVEYIIKYKDISKLTREQLLHTDHLLDSVKICDPAIGSGAFPMGLLQEIYSIKEVIAYETNKDWKPAKVKENIIQNSVYGVDIEKGAVDIARLRFWLSLVVDEDRPRELPNLDYKIVVGDSLLSKVKINDNAEIVEIDWEIKEGTQANMFGIENVLKRKQLLNDISAKQTNYFHPKTTDKEKLATEIRNLKIDILINQLELMINTKGLEKEPIANSKTFKVQSEIFQQTRNWKKLIRDLNSLKANSKKPFIHFDWKLDFPEVLNPYLVNGNGGFDIVIGNPPYLRVQGLREKYPLEIKYYTEKFSTATGRFDLYVLFTEQSFSLLNKTGILNFIQPDKWTNSDFGTGLREFLVKNISKLFSFGQQQVFNVSTYSSLIWITACETNRFKYLRLNKELKNDHDIERYLKNISEEDYTIQSRENLGSEPWVLSDSQSLSIISQLRNLPFTLNDIFSNISQGVVSVGDEIFIMEGQIINGTFKGYSSKTDTQVELEASIMHPLLQGDDVKKYSPLSPKTYILYPHVEKNGKTAPLEEKDFKNKYPKAFNYIFQFKDELIEKKIRYKTNAKYWYALHRSREFSLFKKKKIVTPEISHGSNMTIDYRGLLHNTQVYLLVKREDYAIDLNCLLGILNSTTFWYYLKSTGAVLRGGYFRFKTKYLESFPIPDLNTAINYSLKNIVEYILFLKGVQLQGLGEQLMPTYLEQIINGIVYEIYFPNLIQKNSREILNNLGKLPELNESMSIEEKLGIIKNIFNRLNDKNHPVRTNLFYMDSIPEIRIIEGKNENN